MKIIIKTIFLINIIIFSSNIHAQNKYYDRSQITFLFENPFPKINFFNNLIDSISKTKIYLKLLPDNAPKQYYLQLFKYDNNDNFSSLESGMAKYMQFEYNPVDRPQVNFEFSKASEDPNKFLSDYAIEILEYNFNSKKKYFNLDRVNTRSLINAKDYQFELSKNVERGDNIIKDEIIKIFNNVFIIGVMPLDTKIKKNKIVEISFAVYTFKVGYDLLLESELFWKNCFSEVLFKFCQEQNNLIHISFEDLKIYDIPVDFETKNKYTGLEESQLTLIRLIDKMINTLIK